jgi:hypothetical protein
MHSNSNTGRYTLTGENVKDQDRAFSILKNYVPNAAGEKLIRQGRNLCAVSALEGASGMAAEGHFSSAIAQARAAVHLSSAPAIVWPLITLVCKSLFYGTKRLTSG